MSGLSINRNHNNPELPANTVPIEQADRRDVRILWTIIGALGNNLIAAQTLAQININYNALATRIARGVAQESIPEYERTGWITFPSVLPANFNVECSDPERADVLVETLVRVMHEQGVSVSNTQAFANHLQQVVEASID